MPSSNRESLQLADASHSRTVRLAFFPATEATMHDPWHTAKLRPSVSQEGRSRETLADLVVASR